MSRMSGGRLAGASFAFTASATLILAPVGHEQRTPYEAAMVALAAVLGCAALLLFTRARSAGAAGDAGRLLAGCIALVVACEVAFWIVPGLLDADGDVLSAARHGATLVVLAVLAAAAVRAARARSLDDGPAAALAGAAVLWGASQLDALLHGTDGLEVLTAGDALRSLASLALLAGALMQTRRHPSGQVRRAVTAERRRIARELHDGLAQDLAYIAAHSSTAAARRADPTTARLAEAALSALDESRVAIAGLVHPAGDSIGPALIRTAERIADRGGSTVSVDLERDIRVSPEVHAELLRIVQEATNNAVLHGGASEISLTLTGDPCVTLRIADDGGGFTPATADAAAGFGLASMRERAERAGGHLSVQSHPGRGTVIEVRLA